MTDGTQDSGTKPARSSRARIVSIAVLIVLILAGFAWWRWGGGFGGSTGGGPAPNAAAAPPVTVGHPLQKEVTEYDEYTGQFAAIDSVDIRARVSGYLTEIHFQDGQTVKKGDLLFVIDPRPFQASLDLAQANLERDQAQLVRANLDLKRYTDLSQKEFASQQQFEQARATAGATAASVKADQAQLDQAKLNLEFTHITAPVDGRASNHQVSLGNLIVGGDTGQASTLVTIVSLNPIYFYFDTAETQYLRYRRAVIAGTLKSPRDGSVPVQVQLVDEHSWSHDGNIDFVDNQFNRSAGTLRIRAIFPNPDTTMNAGQFGRIRVPASEPHQAVLIPDTSIIADQARKIVLVVKEDGTVEGRPIQVGPTYQGLRIIRGGLSASDTIILDGVVRARPGGKVTPQAGTITADSQAQ